MTYYLLGICLALAALLVVNALASVLTTMLWRGFDGPTRGWSATLRAQLLFALRTAPLAGSMIFVTALLLPAYIAHEPQPAAETVSVKLALLASVSILGIALALRRGVAARRATRRLVSDWMQRAEPISLDGLNIPAYRFAHSFPVIALVGVVRPRLFIAAQLFDELSPEELTAAVLHEKAHFVARDNFKRLLGRACGDVLAVVPCGRALERRWTEESERAADEYAARLGGASHALSLASALVKLARLVPEEEQPTLPAGAFLIGEASAPLTGRIRRLTWLAGKGQTPGTMMTCLVTHIEYFILSCVFILLALLLTQTHILMTVHAAIESFVGALQ
ncbi:MAG: M56 family metallopeptidase [Acidobacteria bacterium]|nr:M56 family metallopeptidase [Acidobacteriota bacterium]